MIFNFDSDVCFEKVHYFVYGKLMKHDEINESLPELSYILTGITYINFVKFL